MKHQNLAYKVKELRDKKGFTQEMLSEEAKLSLRTIQRIESGQSIPKGDTLTKITRALGVTPEYFLDWKEYEDKGYLMLLNLSALSFIIHPLLGVFVPLLMWISKREKVKFVEDTGKQIINFQLTWTVFVYLVITITFLIVDFESFNIGFVFLLNIAHSHLFFSGYQSILFIVLYSYNIFMILRNFRMSYKGIKNRYVPAISFL